MNNQKKNKEKPSETHYKFFTYRRSEELFPCHKMRDKFRLAKLQQERRKTAFTIVFLKEM